MKVALILTTAVLASAVTSGIPQRIARDDTAAEKQQVDSLLEVARTNVLDSLAPEKRATRKRGSASSCAEACTPAKLVFRRE